MKLIEAFYILYAGYLSLVPAAILFFTFSNYEQVINDIPDTQSLLVKMVGLFTVYLVSAISALLFSLEKVGRKYVYLTSLLVIAWFFIYSLFLEKLSVGSGEMILATVQLVLPTSLFTILVWYKYSPESSNSKQLIKKLRTF
ncbi:hypothetical protein [Endozoicomonas sp.]|uniref:hypothetical protein n=1 Tax=Endozoicomonas sp. TaxID=1892382 RepID=UPI003AF4B5C6